MELLELIEKILRKKVVRNGQIKKVRKSSRQGYIVDPSTGKEKKRTSADKVKLSKIQKKASIKRKSSKSTTNVKRKKSLNLRSWK